MFVQYQISLHSHIIAPHFDGLKRKKEKWEFLAGIES